MKVSKKDVWVFDLDDTLYQENDYQFSGYQHIILTLKTLYNKDLTQVVYDAFNNNKDVFQCICHELNLPYEFKNSLLWLYRLHEPKINLKTEIKKTLFTIKDSSLATAIITDGRSISQRLKASSLGVGGIELLISEEWGETKPGLKRFKYLEEKYPEAERYVYVGDNISKDFITPNKLGWLTIGIEDAGFNIHSQNINNIEESYYPSMWLSCFSDLME